MSQSVSPKDSSAVSRTLGKWYPWFVVAVLMLCFAVAYVDRQILSLLVQPIKRDLGVSDTQIGLLAGLAFAAFYTVMGVPIARLSDRGNRVRIIMVGVFVWSIMTAASGLASTYVTLFLVRLGVGAGEATVAPASYSIIADYFPPDRVAKAVGVYIMGVYIGIGLAMIGGAVVVQMTGAVESTSVPFLGELRSWQLAFLIASLPGFFVLALLALVREPQRRQYLADGSSRVVGIRHTGWREAWVFLRSRRELLLAWTLGSASLGTVITAFFVWVPEMLRRSYGLSIADAGLAFGAILIFFGAPGSWSVGWLVSLFRRRGYADAEVRAALTSTCMILPLGIGAALAPTHLISIVLLAPLIFFMAIAQALSPAVIQLVAPNHLRAQVTALFTLVAVLIGVTAGPALVALITEYAFHDERMLGRSMAIVTGLLTPIGVVLFAYALRPFERCRECAA